MRQLCIFAMVLLTMVLGVAPMVGAADLFVSDGDLIHRFDSVTGLSSGSDISLSSVTGLAIGPNGNLFAASSNPSQVFQYDPATGNQIGANPYVSFNGQNDGHDVQGPEGMHFGSTGDLYIADVTNSEVHRYGSTNNSLGTLTTGNLVQPTDVTFDASGNLYVTSGSAEVYRSLGGTQPLTVFVQQQAGGLTNPIALDFGPDGNLYVVDFGQSAILRYTSTGAFDKLLVSFNGANLFNPSDLVFGPDGKLYVSGIDLNSSAGEVQRFLTDGTPDGVFISSGLNNPSFMAFSVPEPDSVLLAGFALVGLIVPMLRRMQENRR